MPTNATIIGSISVKARGLAASGYKRTLPKLFGAVYLSCAMLLGCGGNGSSVGPSPIPTPTAATPTASPNGGAFTAPTSVTLSDTTPGASISYSVTPTGSTTPGPTTVYSAPFTVSTSSTVTMWATATGYLQSANNTAPFTITPVVTADSTISINLFATLPASNFVHCSATCDLSGLTGVVTPVTADTVMATGAIPVSYTPSSSGGSLSGGNSIYEDHTNTATIAWTLGSFHGTSKITVNVPAPTISAVTPPVVASGSTSQSWTLTGTGFEHESATQTGAQNQGTQAIPVAGATCGTAPASTAIAGVAWNSSISITQYSVGGTGIAIGPYSYWVETDKAADGSGGGSACLPHAFDSTVTGMAISGNGQVVASVNPETGVLSIINGAAVTATYSLAAGAGTPVFADDDQTLYVSNPGAHSIAKVNLQTHELSGISTGYNLPGSIAKDSSGTLYFLATLSPEGIKETGSAHPLTGLFRVDGQSVREVQPPSDYTALAVSGSTLVELSPSLESKTTLVTVLNTRAETERRFTISGYDHMIAALPDGTFLVFAGGAEASVLDLDSRTSSTIAFPAGILSFSGGYVALNNGSVWEVAIAPDGAGKPLFSGSFVVGQPVDNLYGGFAKDSAGILHFQSRTTHGSLTPTALRLTSDH